MLDLVPFHRPILRRQLRGGVRIIETSQMLTSHLTEGKEKVSVIGDLCFDRQFLFSIHVRGQLFMLFRNDRGLFFGGTLLRMRNMIRRCFVTWAARPQGT